MKKLKLEISGSGFEVTVGRLESETYTETVRLLNEEEIPLNEIFDGKLDYWHEQNNLVHMMNVDYESSTVKVSEVDKEQVLVEKQMQDWESDEYEDDNYEAYFDKSEGPVLFSYIYWKFMDLEGEITLPDNEEFDPSKLIFLFRDVMVEDTGGVEVLSEVIYNGQKIELTFIDSSNGKELECNLFH